MSEAIVHRHDTNDGFVRLIEILEEALQHLGQNQVAAQQGLHAQIAVNWSVSRVATPLKSSIQTE